MPELRRTEINRIFNTAMVTQLETSIWIKLVPTVYLGLRATIKDDAQLSIAESVYGFYKLS